MVNPVRKVTNCGTKKNIGLFSSYKMQTGIWYESLLERDYMYLLERRFSGSCIEVSEFWQQGFHPLQGLENAGQRLCFSFWVIPV